MKNTFNYTYTALTDGERAEIEAIQKSYLAQPTSDKFQFLRALDAKAKRPAIIVAITVGVISVLIFGLGLCLCLEWQSYLLGIILGVVGMIGMGCAPIANKILLSWGKKKYGPKIIELSKELLK